MPGGQLAGALRAIRKLAGGRPTEAATHGVLLDRFVRRRDPDSFAALVERHGPLVLGVCRRVLGNLHDAEDGVLYVTFSPDGKTLASGQLDGSVRVWDVRLASLGVVKGPKEVGPKELDALWADLADADAARGAVDEPSAANGPDRQSPKIAKGRRACRQKAIPPAIHLPIAGPDRAEGVVKCLLPRTGGRGRVRLPFIGLHSLHGVRFLLQTRQGAMQCNESGAPGRPLPQDR